MSGCPAGLEKLGKGSFENLNKLEKGVLFQA